ncbi:MAG: 4-hydroxybenzoyl-CoA reductase subunit beta [Alphaproteobacteria bacterium]|nr:4-hydroxybenzoyl-CoA reductase subunit beta [Alphaproteobacteria bacterium]
MSTHLPPFQLARPTSISEAIATIHSAPDGRFLGGGTDLLVNLRRGIGSAKILVDLSGIAELAEITATSEGVSIGAGVALAKLARHPLIGAQYPAVQQAANAIAGPSHRNVGTVGGNLCLDTRCIYYNQSEWWRNANSYCLKHRGGRCHVAPQGDSCFAAFSGDLAPAMLVLGAEVDIVGSEGRRRIPLSELYVEDGRAHLTLKPGELLTAVHLPARPPASAFQKMRNRGAIDYPLAGVAVAMALDGKNVATLRIALTGTNSRPFLVAGTGALAGTPLDPKLFSDVERLLRKQVQPMRTTLTSPNYRRVAATALARRLISDLAARA